MSGIVNCIVFGIIISLTSVLADELFPGDPCTTTSGENGICRLFSNCQQAVEDFRSRKIKPKLCSYMNAEAIICCPKSPSSLMCDVYAKEVYQLRRIPTQLLEPEFENVTICGSSVQELIVGGESAVPTEFPHMVLLGFGDPDISWKCGGSLISKRYVLTAAHCVRSRGLNVTWALLGDLIIDNTTDASDPQKLRISAIYAHPSYKPPAKYNDIALLKLERDVEFNEYVRPACLDVAHTTRNGTVATATGWGITMVGGFGDTSKILMKVNLPFRHSNTCVDEYQVLSEIGTSLKQGFTPDSMVCAGSYVPGKDTCGGDSGGPLQVKLQTPFCMYSIVGITSFGPKGCAMSNMPTIYTRVAHYIDWIEGMVWPNGVSDA